MKQRYKCRSQANSLHSAYEVYAAGRQFLRRLISCLKNFSTVNFEQYLLYFYSICYNF